MSAAKTGLLVLTVTAIAALVVHGPVAQPATYHDFADTRSLGALPNWQNVLSNLAFLVAGVLGALSFAARRGAHASAAWLYVFLGAIAVSVGSGWYHLAPSGDTLVWDRMAMGIAFMAYFVALLEEYVDERITRSWLLVLVPLSAASVVHWYASGDLRAWILVQGLPILATPLILLLSHKRHAGQHYIWAACACYVLAKGAELADAALYEATAHIMSGHAAKHLLAGAGVLCFWRMLVARAKHERALDVLTAAARQAHPSP